MSACLCKRDREHFYTSAITSGWMVQVSHCECAVTPVSVSHSLAAWFAGPHKGCQRRKNSKRERQTQLSDEVGLAERLG